MTIIEQIATYLQDDLSLGTLGTDIFIGFMPDDSSTADAIIAVLDTGGTGLNSNIADLKFPTIQIMIRDVDYDTGKAVLDSVRGLHGLFGNLVSGQDYFLKLHALAEGGHLGRDAQGRDLFSINFTAEVR